MADQYQIESAINDLFRVVVKQKIEIEALQLTLQEQGQLDLEALARHRDALLEEARPVFEMYERIKLDEIPAILRDLRGPKH